MTTPNLHERLYKTLDRMISVTDEASRLAPGLDEKVRFQRLKREYIESLRKSRLTHFDYEDAAKLISKQGTL